jgi:hypothetical protein
VLKVPSQNTEMPPMGDEMISPMDGGMEDENSMGNEMMPNENDSQMPTVFDSNFDAGVEADEETDPKRYIQQLTGKLSQSLNSYNNENGEPDVELGKYVLGMLVKQGVKGMDDNDKKEIIKKINTDNSEELPDDEIDSDNDMEDVDDEIGSNDMNMQTESKVIKCTKKQIFESFGIAIDNETPSQKTIDTKIKSGTKMNRRTRPFEAPKKFKE